MNGYRQNKQKNSRTCEVHGEPKEFFCVARDCMTDLCRLCMRFHNELHQEHNTQPAIENYEQTIAISVEKLNRMTWGYNNEIKKLEQTRGAKENEWEAFISEIHQKILEKKRAVESLVDAYFQEIETETLNQYIYPSKKMAIDKLDTPIQRLVLKVEKLEHVKRYLTKDQKEKEMIKYVFYKDDRYILESLRGKVDELIARECSFTPNPDKIEITLNRELINDFYSVLANFISLNVDLKDLTNEMAGMHNMTNFGDVTQDINPDNSINHAYKEVSGLNGSLGQNEQLKIPNPYPKEPYKQPTSSNSSNAKLGRNSNSNSRPQLPAINREMFKQERSFKIFDTLDENQEQPLTRTQKSQIGLQNPVSLNNNNRQKDSNSSLENIKSNNKKNLEVINEEISIEASNFFEEQSICHLLHFFEPKTKNFYFVEFSSENLELLSSSRKLHFDKITLDIDFLIGRHSRSVITRTGCVVLMGGLHEKRPDSREAAVEFINSVYMLDFEKSTLVKMESMNKARAAHSVLAITGNILVVGGITDTLTVTDSCELFNFEEEKWFEIGGLNEACMNSTLCLIHGKYVVKFGGKVDEVKLSKTIEILDLTTLEWKVVKIGFSIPVLPSLACAVEIKSGQVLFFGGVYEKGSDKSNLVFLISFSEQGELLKFAQQDFCLPFEDGFSDGQAIIHNEVIFALQNDSNSKDKSVQKMDVKRIVMIDKSRCKVLN